MSEQIKDSLRVLLSEIVDYAGLFPPAQLSMSQAVSNFNEYLQGKFAWMLGRFIVPADLLDNFTAAASPFWTQKNSPVWRASVLARGSLADSIQQIEEFNQRHEGRAVIDTLEARADDAETIKNAGKILPARLTTYFEIPIAVRLAEQIPALAITRTRAKIRTGGVVVEAFPPIDELLRFLRVCIAANVPFKATAGLHHPVRCSKPLTYEADSPVGVMHGFLNLFLAAGFMRQSLNNNFVRSLLADTDPANFVFDDDAAQWRGNRIETEQLKIIRQRNIISFGSCSFLEPIEDLQQLGWL